MPLKPLLLTWTLFGTYRVVLCAVDERPVHAEVVSLGEVLCARGTGEAAHVVHELPGAHHELRRTDDPSAPRAPTLGEQPEGRGAAVRGTAVR